MIINPNDNVEIREDGHKFALRDIAEGENVIKYGMPIGHATCAIKKGEHVHVHNVKTNLGEVLEYRYEPDEAAIKGWKTVEPKETFLGYRHPDGRVGIRNDIWVIPLVGCVNRLAERLAQSCGGLALTHPYGCSQMGQDHETTANMLAQFCRHPNAGGVLVVSLGCENNTLESFKGRLGLSPEDQDGAKIGLNIRFVKAQDPGDEYEKGLALIKELDAARPKGRVPVSVSELVVGLKCGGSDGFSGITANPLCGTIAEKLTALGGTAILTEVPEMFGAETFLMERADSEETFQKIVCMINGFKQYYLDHDQPVYDNPSPGNKRGGITTLEEKSLGCIQKGGHAVVTDTLEMGEACRKPGLNLVTGPGNDSVSITNLLAAGAQLLLFTTGRGNPLGTAIPTLKLASNPALFERKRDWLDFNAGMILEESSMEAASELLWKQMIRVASGETRARNEERGYREIMIFKDGVIL